MKTVNIEPISKWMHRNAREVELAVWKYHFEEGTKQDVVQALMYYQNEDGGFGHAIEPDNWNSESTSYATLCVMKLLEEIEFYEKEHPILQGIQRYIENTLLEGWHFDRLEQ